MSPNLTQMIAFEEGSLSERETIEMFAGLIKSGLAWQLQGFYGRTAASLIEEGYISQDGEILVEFEDGEEVEE